MTTSFKLVAGTWEQELVYDAATQATYKLQYDSQLQLDQPAVQMHQPDNDAAVPVRAHDQNRMMILGMNIPADATWDSIYNATAALKRKVDGADSQALRYWTDNDVDRVVLRVQQDGATNYTDIPILHGLVDDGAAYYMSVAELNTLAYNIRIVLVVAPYGEGAAISLQNDLPSSPHFLEDSGAPAGLADGWNASGTASYGLSTNQWLIGGKSQFVSGTSIGAGLFHAPISVTDSVGAYIWTQIQSGTITYKMRNTTDGADVVSYTVSSGTIAASADMTTVATDGTGNTWYRLNLSGSVTGTKSVRIEVAATTSTCSFFVDMAYLQGGATAAPVAYCSTTSLENRYDPDVATANINYIDFWGIPGDAPALIQSQISTTNSTSQCSISVSRVTDGTYSYSDFLHFIDSDDFSSGTGWSTTGSSGTVGDSYLTSSVPNANECIYSYPTDGTKTRVLTTPSIAFALVYATDAATTIDARITIGGSTALTFDSVSPDATSAWRMVQLGLVNLVDEHSLYQTAVVPIPQLRFSAGGSAGTIRVDGFYLLPLERYFQTELRTAGSAGNDPKIDGVNNQVFMIDSGLTYRAASFVGEIPDLTPGNVGNRLIFNTSGTDTTPTYETFGISDDIVISEFLVYPRSRHLLGVL